MPVLGTKIDCPEHNRRRDIPHALFSQKGERGFTIIELIIVIAVIGALASIAISSYSNFIYKTKVSLSISQIYSIGNEISILYSLEAENLPDSLADIGYDTFLDPWGNPYQYLKIDGGKKGLGKMRKDRFLVPLNSDFDLYSMGRDGKSIPPLTAAPSHDDIVRASNGAFVGLASKY